MSEARIKSAVVKIESQSKVAHSEPPYETIMQQIIYLLSAIINQNANNNGQNGPRCNNGNGKFPNMRTQKPRKDRKDMICWGCRGTRHGWREYSTPRQGNKYPFQTGQLTFQQTTGGGSTDLQSSPSPNQGLGTKNLILFK